MKPTILLTVLGLLWLSSCNSPEPTQEHGAPNYHIDTTGYSKIKPVYKTIEPIPARSNSVDDELKLIEIYTDSQMAVENALVSPGSAQFPVFDRSMLIKTNDTTYKVRSYVDSQNRMGGLMRGYYSCKIIYHPKTKSYDYTNLKITQQ